MSTSLNIITILMMLMIIINIIIVIIVICIRISLIISYVACIIIMLHDCRCYSNVALYLYLCYYYV